ncbi:HAMP domain-containing methyl-accepting chemotaxis protein [Pseudovibrio sp. Tun.PSC04-5.I4]|uniref:methyl-accepting chemotaxis protein n=1 Tax=Pseudovibrio sp. Tun.PSC04-5.I4 TaxID=1798213 RepID=UPI0008905A8A|nr:HAMP domain-containing methyl-accepting chemotaxis protein [Pseudovibrio sp. Tun.PSC04-5.I4]SDR22693.1 methyl-accepting chemotaxis protein [Pseudovibrio sp. Tun.PSC04-5.I4]
MRILKFAWVYSVVTRVLALGLLPIIVLGGALIFLSQMNSDNAAFQKNTQSYNQLMQNAQAIGAAVDRMRAIGGEFLLNSNSEAADVAASARDRVVDLVEKSRELNTQGIDDELYDSLEGYAYGFSETFGAVVEATIERGTDADGGLIAALQGASYTMRLEINKERRKLNVSKDTHRVASLLKDLQAMEWTIGVDGYEIEKETFKSRIEQFDMVLKNADMSAAAKAKVEELWVTYTQTFEQIEVLSADIQEEMTFALEQLDEMLPAAEALNKIGVEGEQQAAIQHSEASAASMRRFLLQAGAMGVIGLMIAGFIAWKISRPLANLHSAMSVLAKGDVSINIEGTKGRDEFAKMAKILEVFRANAIERNQLNEERDTDNKHRQIREQKVATLVSEFEKVANMAGEGFNTAIQSLHDASFALNVTVESVSDKAGKAGEAVSHASSSVATVASASEEMSHSIKEVASEAVNSKEIADEVGNLVVSTSKTIQELAETASRIGQVVSLIKDIADQTNLLALNATIEAARAGEMGKGFAVVASEVKNLANQTSTATEEISHQIHAIQQVSGDAVGSIDKVMSMMEKLSGSSSAVAAAVEQQAVTVSEIARSVTDASDQSRIGETEMGEVANTIESSTKTAENINDQADSISEEADQFNRSIKTFLEDVQAA